MIAQQYSLREESNTEVEADLDGSSTNVADCAEGEHMPATFIVESGPLIQIVHFDYPPHGAAVDIEKQRVSHRPLPRWHNPGQRLRLFVVLFFMSAFLTLLTVMSVSALKTDRYFLK